MENVAEQVQKILGASKHELHRAVESFATSGECLLMDMYLKRNPGFVDVFIWSTSAQNQPDQIEAELLKLQLHFEALRAALPELSKTLKGSKMRYAMRSKGEVMQPTPILAVRHNSETIFGAEISVKPLAIMDAQLITE